MKNKRLLQLACGFLFLGAVIIMISLSVNGFDRSKFCLDSGGEWISKEEIVTEPFQKLAIEVSNSDVSILPFEEEHTRIEYFKNKRFGYQIGISRNELFIKRKENRAWYEILSLDFSLKGKEVKIYLPKKLYKKLNVKSVSGNLKISDLFFEMTELQTVSGEMDLSSLSGDLSAESTSGNIYLSNSKTTELELHSISGNITAKDVTVSREFEAETTSGDINLSGTDAKDYSITSVSGNLDCNIKSNKQFKVKSISGKTDYPNMAGGEGIFDAESTSGDIKISIE